MQNSFLYNSLEQEQPISAKSEAFIKCTQEAARRIRFVQQAEQKCRGIRNALLSDNKEQLWAVLQNTLVRYMGFINSISCLTGVCICYVDAEYYNKVSIEDIKHQLRLMIGFIYVYEAAHSTMKEQFKECLKKCLKESGFFSKDELRMINTLMGV